MLDFDMLCTYRLDLYDRDCRKQLSKLTAKYLGAAMSGSTVGDD